MSIELLAPAGNMEKLVTAFDFGADAAYMGLTSYSLRKNADNFTSDQLEEVKRIKERYGRRLYCTMNILFSESQIRDVENLLPTLKDSPFDEGQSLRRLHNLGPGTGPPVPQAPSRQGAPPVHAGQLHKQQCGQGLS